MDEIRVSSWSQLQEELFAESFDDHLQRYRSPYFFRGLDDASYKLDTTLIRLGGPYWELERHLLRNFRKYAHRDVVARDSIWHWLVVAQHHGLPTRLLDWTYSPFIAMHFAAADIAKFNVDGVIWMVHFRDVRQYLPDDLEEERDRVGGIGFDVEMLSKKFKTIDDLDKCSPDDFAIFFEPPSIDDRIVNQYALFSVLSNPTLPFDEWLNKRQVKYRRLIIPAQLKWEIRDKLDHANITERVLFPGLDGLSKWLKRTYSPKI